MKWNKVYFGMSNNRRIAYEANGYRIVKSQSINIWTGRIMSEQVWDIYKNGEKIDCAFTLRDAKVKADKDMGIDKGARI